MSSLCYSLNIYRQSNMLWERTFNSKSNRRFVLCILTYFFLFFRISRNHTIMIAVLQTIFLPYHIFYLYPYVGKGSITYNHSLYWISSRFSENIEALLKKDSIEMPQGSLGVPPQSTVVINDTRRREENWMIRKNEPNTT